MRLNRSVKAILADPATPAWIKETIVRLRQREPMLTAFYETLHDMRVGAR